MNTIKLDADDCEALVKTLNSLPAVGGPFAATDEAIWRIRDAFAAAPEGGVLLTPVAGEPEEGAVTRTDQPQERLTRLCDGMTAALEAHPEYGGTEKCAIFLDDPDGSGRSGLVLHGYEDETEALANLFVHMKHIFEAAGKTLTFHALPDGDPASN